MKELGSTKIRVHLFVLAKKIKNSTSPKEKKVR